MTYRLKQSDVNEKKRKNSVLYITFEVYKSLANASNLTRTINRSDIYLPMEILTPLKLS